jgi:hypothetical protein
METFVITAVTTLNPVWLKLLFEKRKKKIIKKCMKRMSKGKALYARTYVSTG